MSPIHASFTKFPPVHISVGQCEALLDQSQALAVRMRSENVLVDLDEAADMVHAFQQLAP